MIDIVALVPTVGSEKGFTAKGGAMESSEYNEGTDSDLVLIEVAENIVLLLGDDVPDGLELEHFYLDQDSKGELTSALSAAAASVNIGVQALGGVKAVEGLVRLSPQTMAALKEFSPIVKDGWNLGTLRNGPDFAHSVRWAHATDIQATQFMSSLGPAMVLLAITAQIASMDRKLDEAVALGTDILGQLRRDHRSALRGICKTIDIAVKETKEIGYVTKGVFTPVKSVISDLRSEHDAFWTYFDKHRVMLQPENADRQKYLEEHANEIIADAQGLILAELAQYRYGILRGGSLLVGEPSGDDKKLSRSIIERIEQDSRESLKKTREAIEDVYSQMQIIALTSQPSIRDRVWVQRASNQTESTAVKIASALGSLLGTEDSHRDEVVPAITVADDSAEEPLELLRWVLARDEVLLALAEARPQGWAGTASYLGVTQTRFFVSPEKALFNGGEIKDSYPLSDLRYVRLTFDSKDRATLDVITKDTNLSFRLTAKESAQPIKDLADLLMSASRIPESEQRSSLLLEEVSNRVALITTGAESSSRTPIGISE